MDECTAKAETLRSSDVMEAIKYYIISSAPEVGLELGLKVVKGEIKWTNLFLFSLKYFIGYFWDKSCLWMWPTIEDESLI